MREQYQGRALVNCKGAVKEAEKLGDVSDLSHTKLGQHKIDHSSTPDSPNVIDALFRKQFSGSGFILATTSDQTHADKGIASSSIISNDVSCGKGDLECVLRSQDSVVSAVATFLESCSSPKSKP